MFEQNVTLGPGTGTTTQHTLEIILMLLGAALLGLWLGWILWNKYKQQADKLKTDILSLTATNDAQRTEINDLKAKLANLETESGNLNAQVVSLTRNNQYQRDKIDEQEAEISRLQARNRQLETELGLSYDPDSPAPADIPLEINLPSEDSPIDEEPMGETLIVEVPVDESPAVEVLDFDEDGIADEPLDALELPPLTIAPDMPEEEGLPLQTPALEGGLTPVADVLVLAPLAPESDAPDTTTQEELDASIELDAPFASEDDAPDAITLEESAPSAEPEPIPAPSIILAAEGQRDDLTVIEGIGPKIQELLYQYGIKTYRQLASTDVTRIKEILRSAGPQLAMHDPGTWTAQALLAANDQWENLKAYQDYLSAGKSPKKTS